MTEISRKYEELYDRDAKALKEDALRELSAYAQEQSKKFTGGEEPRAIAGPYSFTVSELISQVEDDTQIGRDMVKAISNLKATLARGGE